MPVNGDPLTLPDRLRELSERTPEDPWLFFAEGLDWRWRSWSQVADQAARAAAALAALPRPARVAVSDRFHPDAVTAILAVLAAGHVAVLAADPDVADPDTTAPDVTDAEVRNLPRVVLPEVRSRLLRWTPAALPTLAELDADAVVTATGEVLGHRALAAAAGRWSALLAPPPRGRPIVLASGRLAAVLRPSLLAGVLAGGAAWILEDDPDLFLATALGLRPTLALASSEELARLGEALVPRRHRRWHRFTAVVATDDGDPGKVWGELGVAVLRLGSEDFAAARRTR